MLKQSGRQFSVEPDELILAAALRNGIGLPYGCKNGACGSCKGNVVSGQIKHGTYSPLALSCNESASGVALLCCAMAQSDLEIDVFEAVGIGDMQVRKLLCRVISIDRKADDIIVLKLKLPTNERLQYLAGQHLNFILQDGSRRSYSMANAPNNDGPIELHIRHMPGGKFTDHVFNAMKERDILRFEAPLGTFCLQENSRKPIVLLASGTGFAPIKAIIEYAVFKNIERPMMLYWGARRRRGLYQVEIVEQWVKDIPSFRFVPVLSEPDALDNWAGRTGFVHKAVTEDLLDLSDYEVYACGAPIMIKSAYFDFTQHYNLPANAFYADAFTSAAHI